jgi:acetylornithine deacetylase/succinyl-diaminopimelate desuccinylase-like protein
VIVESGLRLGGDLLLTAHGRHESATNETLEALIRKGVYGDAVIVAELGGDDLPIAGMGLAFFNVRISRQGEILHETVAPPDMPHPILAGVRTVARLVERARALEKDLVPGLGPESLFVGRFQSGDYYNRLPATCEIAGTRRFGPQRRIADVRNEFDELAEQISKEMQVQVDVWLDGLESFRIAADERIVTTVRRAYRQVTGRELPLAGTRTAANAPHFVHLAGVPAVYYGVRHLTGHSDDERVELAELVRSAKVYIHAILDYVGIAGGST